MAHASVAHGGKQHHLADRRSVPQGHDEAVDAESDAAGSGTSYDPQASSISGAFVGALNDYLFRDLGYQTPLTYRPNNYAGIGDDWSLQHNSADGQQPISDTSASRMRPSP